MAPHNAADFLDRLVRVEALMLANVQPAAARHAVMDKFGLTPIEARRWMAAVRRWWRLLAGKPTEASRAEKLARLRELYEQCRTAGDFKTALATLSLEAQMENIIQPAMKVLRDGADNDNAAPMSIPVMPVFVVQPSVPRDPEVLRLTGGKVTK